MSAKINLADKKRIEIITDSVTANMKNPNMFGGLANVINLSKFPENKNCADCGKDDNKWVSLEIGCFLCMDCAQMHKVVGGKLNNLQSFEHDNAIWELEQIQLLETTGNQKTREIYENRLPSYYLTPREHDCPLVRENFVREKYELRSFVNENRDEGASESEIVVDANKHPFYKMPQKPLILELGYRGPKQKKEVTYKFAFINSYAFLYKPKKQKPHLTINLAGASANSGHFLYLGLSVYEIKVSTKDGKDHFFVFHQPKFYIDCIHHIRRTSVYYTSDYGRKITEMNVKKTVLDIDQSIIDQCKVKGNVKIQKKKKWAMLIDTNLFYFKKETAKKSHPDGSITIEEFAIEKIEDKKPLVLLTAPFSCSTIEFCDDKQMNDWVERLKRVKAPLTIERIINFQTECVYKKK